MKDDLMFCELDEMELYETVGGESRNLFTIILYFLGDLLSK